MLIFDSDEELVTKIASKVKDALKEQFTAISRKTRKDAVPRYLTRDEAAKTLRISISSIYRLMKNKTLPYKKVGRRVLILESDVQSIILDMYV
ncbi:MAG: helix-turn-helix domain-containing protein [Candidatus Symbiothrix sp.]|nr:helix-turn-helix domain-containing protein [Candidatus Symbiothrix sp.]